MEQGTLLHFQWTGSDANNNGNAGNGRAGTDRSNLVQAGGLVSDGYAQVAMNTFRILLA